MSVIRGTIQGGKVVLDKPAGWPEGAKVMVELEPITNSALPDDDDSSPGAIEVRLSLMDQVGPWMSPQEFAEWERMRREEKAFQLSQWEKWNKELEGLFE